MKQYVYYHIDPETKDVVYVGTGFGGRAWHDHNRSNEHKDWLDDLCNKGITMDQFVIVHHKGMNKQDALVLENQLINTLEPKFNKKFSLDRTALIKGKLFDDILSDRIRGMTYKQLGEKYNIYYKTIERSLHDKRNKKEIEFQSLSSLR